MFVRKRVFGRHMTVRSDEDGTAAGDARSERTRAALIAAFNQLFFTQGFEAIRTREIAANAQVGRSTLYEHFDGKDEILAEAAEFLFTVLADACTSNEMPPKLPWTVAHFWENRRVGLGVFEGTTAKLLTRRLAVLIEKRLEAASPPDPIVPIRLGAAQLATAQVALLAAWLSGNHRATPAAFAEALYAASRGAADALLAGGRSLTGKPSSV
jgi:AcrR family transcriptional regulator